MFNNPFYTLANLNVPNSGTLSPGYGAVPDPNATNVIYTTNTTNPIWSSSPYGTSGSGRIVLGGPDADIEINGESIVDTLKQIKEQLQIPNRLNRNARLEDEFEELKQLGEQYQDLETKFLEQKRVFDILKKQD
jgi:hypothetical protein